MRDAADATHALDRGHPPQARRSIEVLLTLIYEGKCHIDEGQLTEGLEASARLVVDDLKEACAGAIPPGDGTTYSTNTRITQRVIVLGR